MFGGSLSADEAWLVPQPRRTAVASLLGRQVVDRAVRGLNRRGPSGLTLSSWKTTNSTAPSKAPSVRELREPVTSGAWARDLFGPWRPRQSDGWRRGGGQPSRPMVPAGPQPADRLGPARRPLVLLAALVMVAAAVVVSSVAVMSPYGTRGNPELLDQTAQATFAAQASKECAAVLPTYRVVLTSSVDGPSISAAADQLDLLGQHLSDLPATGGLQALVVEWLQAWKNYTADQRHYANIIGPAGRLHGRPVLRQMPGSARLAASLAHQQADDQAVQADRESSNLGLTACRLEQGQTA